MDEVIQWCYNLSIRYTDRPIPSLNLCWIFCQEFPSKLGSKLKFAGISCTSLVALNKTQVFQTFQSLRFFLGPPTTHPTSIEWDCGRGRCILWHAYHQQSKDQKMFQLAKLRLMKQASPPTSPTPSSTGRAWVSCPVAGILRHGFASSSKPFLSSGAGSQPTVSALVPVYGWAFSVSTNQLLMLTQHKQLVSASIMRFRIRSFFVARLVTLTLSLCTSKDVEDLSGASRNFEQAGCSTQMRLSWSGHHSPRLKWLK